MKFYNQVDGTHDSVTWLCAIPQKRYAFLQPIRRGTQLLQPNVKIHDSAWPVWHMIHMGHKSSQSEETYHSDSQSRHMNPQPIRKDTRLCPIRKGRHTIAEQNPSFRPTNQKRHVTPSNQSEKIKDQVQSIRREKGPYVPPIRRETQTYPVNRKLTKLYL